MKETNFKERVGSVVVLNGGYVLIDHSDEESQEGQSTIIYIWSKDEETREKEIEVAVKLVHSGNGSKTNVSNTIFQSSYILKYGNDKVFENHIGLARKVVVFNKEAREFFLIMDENESLAKVEDFLDEANEKYSDLIEELGYYRFQLPRPHGLGELKVDGEPTFEVVMHSRLVFIKLEAMVVSK